MDRDRRRAADVANSMDVARRGEPGDVAGGVCAAPDLDQALAFLVEPEELFVLDALDYSEDAPGHVIVDRRHLPGPPHESDDRERAVGLAVEQVAPISLGVPGLFLRSEEVRGRETALQRFSHEPSRRPPVLMLFNCSPNGGHQLADPRRVCGGERNHWRYRRPVERRLIALLTIHL